VDCSDFGFCFDADVEGADVVVPFSQYSQLHQVLNQDFQQVLELLLLPKHPVLVV